MSNMTIFSTIQTKIVCTSTLFFFGCPWVRLLSAMLALQVESSFVLMVVQNSFVLLMLVHNTSFVDVQKACCHTGQLMQWPNLMLKGLTR
jgi:hypothetical protein